MKRVDDIAFEARWLLQSYYFIIVLFLSVLTLALALILSSAGADWKALLGTIGTLISLIFLIQRQQLEETRLIKDLITDFNKRYDRLNATLNIVVRSSHDGEDLDPRVRDKLYDYFNLCGEEYLFYKKGYIYPEAWRTWTRGMGEYFADPRIRELWNSEIKDSYYGLDLDPHFRKQLRA